MSAFIFAYVLQQSPWVWFVTFVVLFVLTAKWKHNYWKRRGMQCIKPNLFFGNLEIPIIDKENFSLFQKKHYDYARSKGIHHLSLYAMWSPAYMPIKPEIIKEILTKAFHHFDDRGFYSNEKDDPLSGNLFMVEGKKWKILRSKFTPTFTSGKMKMMFMTLLEVGKQLNNAMTALANKGEPIDIKGVLACYTTDVIGSCAFGIDCNSFENPNSEFRRHGERIFVNTPYEQFKYLFAMSFPDLARRLKVITTPKLVIPFFLKIVGDTIEYREKNNVVRNDFMQILIDMKASDQREGVQELTVEEIAAQVYLFFAAGFETSSTTMTFCLFELASSPKIQDRLRKEIAQVLEKHNRKITYEALAEMKYMQQVIDETLRKYPPLAILNRKCVQDYQIPDTNYTIKKGTPIFISSIGLQHDPEYFPDPDTFDPERFSDENKPSIVPYTYLPFGDGPRNCIGLRFGIMQTKVGLTVLLKNFSFDINPKTKIPLKMDPSNFILSSLDKIWLNVNKIMK